MAALPYTAVTYDARVTTTPLIQTTQGTSVAPHVKGSTDRFAETGRGKLWGGDSWPLFAVNNRDRVTSSYYDEYKELRGYVQDGSGAGIARMVIAISQLTQAILGQTVSDGSGQFTMPLYLSNDDKVTVLAIPLDADDRNVVAYRDIVPVSP